jgi:heat shock protein HslJ
MQRVGCALTVPGYGRTLWENVPWSEIVRIVDSFIDSGTARANERGLAMRRYDRDMITLIVVFVVSTVLLACQQERRSPNGDTPDRVNRGGSAITVAPSAEEAANATYNGICDHPVTLSGGQWEGEPFVVGGASRPSVRVEPDFHLTADLNGDTAEETVVLLTEQSGGTGTFSYLAILGRSGRGLVNLATALVGDRVQIRDFHTDAGRIVLDVVQQGPGDEMCCPSENVTRIWTLGTGGLVESPAQTMGKSSHKDLEGVEWVLTDLGPDEPAPSQPEVTLIFEDSQVRGKSACNTYFAQLIFMVHDSPGGFALGPIGRTKKLCPHDVMSLEERYLERLGGARRWSYRVGKLAITWTKGSDSGVLIFTRR